MQQFLKIGVIAVLFIGSESVGEESDDDDGLRLVEHFLNEVVTLSGRFEQQLVDADDIVVEESSGTLQVQRPGQFRWSYIHPYQQILVADGLNIWSYDVDLEQVTVKGQSDALGGTPAELLGGSSDALDDFDYLGSSTDRGTVWVSLKPKNTDSGFHKVELGFSGDDLTRMLFTDNLEQTTLVALFDVSFNESIDAQQFEFIPPSGVDVVGEPTKIPAEDR